MDQDVEQWIRDSYVEDWTKDSILDDGEWRYRIVVYRTGDIIEHYKRVFTQKASAIKRAKELIKSKGVKKIEVLPRGAAIYKNEVVTIQ